MDIGSSIKKLRESNNLSLKALSEQCGLSYVYIHEIEKGKKVPSIDSLLKISSTFNITVSELIGETKPSLTPELKSLLDNAKTLTSEQLEQLTKFLKLLN